MITFNSIESDMINFKTTTVHIGVPKKIYGTDTVDIDNIDVQ
jgi:hypothetical protein